MKVSTSLVVGCVLFLSSSVTLGMVSEGWRMQDRFLGFRFELTPAPTELKNDIKGIIRDFADERFCFGWVQDTSKETIAGEVRCKKVAGHEMKEFLWSLSLVNKDGSNQIAIKEYDDTLIRLHFTHFKIVSPRRNTCFRDEPHRCSQLYFEGEDGTSFRDR